MRLKAFQSNANEWIEVNPDTVAWLQPIQNQTIINFINGQFVQVVYPITDVKLRLEGRA